MDFTTEHSSLGDERLDHARYAPILAENVKRLRKQAKINKKTFALMVGIGRPFLNKIENGAADPRLSVVVKMADALETTPSYLMTDHSAPEDGAADPLVPGRGHARLM